MKSIFSRSIWIAFLSPRAYDKKLDLRNWKLLGAFWAVWLCFVCMACNHGNCSDTGGITPEKLNLMGIALSNDTHYLEALDLLDEARDMLEAAGRKESQLYTDVLYYLALTKIKARRHQCFPAHYVKSALSDISTVNKIREKLTGVLPQKLAEGYYLEGHILKRYFMRKTQAVACFTRAVQIDPSRTEAKRELSELIAEEEHGDRRSSGSEPRTSR